MYVKCVVSDLNDIPTRRIFLKLKFENILYLLLKKFSIPFHFINKNIIYNFLTVSKSVLIELQL